MVKEKKGKPAVGTLPKKLPLIRVILIIPAILSVLGAVFAVSFINQYENIYRDQIYPGVTVDFIPFGGKSQRDLENYFNKKNKKLAGFQITLKHEDRSATISGKELKAGYDVKLSSIQAYSIGRSGNILSDIYHKWRAKAAGINLTAVMTMDNEYIDETITYLANSIDKKAEDALFNFTGGRVTAFKPSRSGVAVNREKTKKLVMNFLEKTIQNGTDEKVEFKLPVEIVLPSITTENSNDFGIKELIGTGKSKFVGSIASRIHNIELAASRINGRLIPPGETFSFNSALGDVSSATGYQPAYIIKDGRTVLGDGGGVCQVSTTLFRAALSSGLPVVERWAHSYRVSYYEQDSGPGIDATVFAPSVDLKFTNDTPAHILIQAETNKSASSLTFSLYGVSDGRVAQITKPVILSQTPPPPDLYQDDPTLDNGAVKQVDWKAWGAKVNFDYKVTRDREILFQKSFFSNFQPWQAVFLRGTRI